MPATIPFPDGRGAIIKLLEINAVVIIGSNSRYESFTTRPIPVEAKEDTQGVKYSVKIPVDCTIQEYKLVKTSEEDDSFAVWFIQQVVHDVRAYDTTYLNMEVRVNV